MNAIRRSILSTVVFASALSVAQNSYALGYFSRACRFDMIPSSLQGMAAYAFAALGATPITEIMGLPGATVAQQKYYWVLESITSDWGLARYYLWASSAHYRQVARDDALGYPSDAYELARVAQGPWQASEWNTATMTNSYFKIFLSNFQGPLPYSARAGAPTIVERFDATRLYSVYGDYQLYYQSFRVYGAHYYYDPAMQKIVYLGTSRAGDCNLTQWGLEHG